MQRASIFTLCCISLTTRLLWPDMAIYLHNVHYTPIVRIQKCALKIVTSLSPSCPSSHLVANTRILPFMSQRNYSSTVLVNAIINTNCPLPLSSLSFRTRNTRNAGNGNLNLISCRNACGGRLIQLIGAKIWILIPTKVYTCL